MGEEVEPEGMLVVRGGGCDSTLEALGLTEGAVKTESTGEAQKGKKELQPQS